jgi:hypothetical protein
VAVAAVTVPAPVPFVVAGLGVAAVAVVPPPAFALLPDVALGATEICAIAEGEVNAVSTKIARESDVMRIPRGGR